MKEKTNEENKEINFKEMIDNIDKGYASCEVLYNMGEQEVLKRDGKYYISSTINPSIYREITRESARELESIYELKDKLKTDTFFKE